MKEYSNDAEWKGKIHLYNRKAKTGHPSNTECYPLKERLLKCVQNESRARVDRNENLQYQHSRAVCINIPRVKVCHKLQLGFYFLVCVLFLKLKIQVFVYGKNYSWSEIQYACACQVETQDKYLLSEYSCMRPNFHALTPLDGKSLMRFNVMI